MTFDVNTRREAERHRVDLVYRLLHRLERNQRHDRGTDLLTRHAHVGPGIAKNRRVEQRTVTAAAFDDSGAGDNCLRNPRFRTPGILLADHRANRGCGIAGIAHLQRARRSEEQIDEAAEDLFVHEQLLRRRARLAGAAKSGVRDAGRRTLQVGVFADDCRRDTPEFQRDRAQTDGPLQQSADRRASGERVERDRLIVSEPSADLCAGPLYQVRVRRRQARIE